MAATNQVVSVKIGAVLTASFGTGFANAEKRVNAFSAVVTRANTKLEALRKTITAIGDSLKRMNAVVVTSESRLASLTTALGAQANAARSANTANAAMARGYQSAARARTAWNTAMAHMPPALPRSLTNPPPPFPRQPRGGGGGGNPAGSGRGTPLPRPGQVIGQAAVGLGMASLLSRSMGAVGSGMKNNALFEGDIQGVLNTADVDSSQLDATRKQLLAMTGRGRTNQKAEDLLGGLNVFASAGGIDFADQLAATEASGRTATASRAKVEDISKTSVSLMQNLKIKATDLGDALGMMTVAGKAGSFELKDMAQHFPSLEIGRASCRERVSSPV